jgi:2-keto-4-pentenoate hydratase/2-oxohepta-3-ene-1,7-dioic acid hydratase in catechol pathway
MKIVSFGPKDQEKPGAVLGDRIVDLTSVDTSLPKTVRAILADNRLEDVARILESAESLPSTHLVPLSDVRLGPPITDPSKIICLGLNYVDHAREQGKEPPKWPMLFSKAPSCLIGDKDPIPLHPDIQQLDHEVELVFVIGKRGKNVPIDAAFEHIAGYGTFMDISARDVQYRDKQWFRGKSFDGFGPFGPYLVTKDEIDDPHDLKISLDVNGDTKQKSTTGEIHFKIDYLVHYLSSTMTLEPGDLVSTGTPGGVGVFDDPPRFLKKGDVLRATIESLGILTNTIV